MPDDTLLLNTARLTSANSPFLVTEPGTKAPLHSEALWAGGPNSADASKSTKKRLQCRCADVRTACCALCAGGAFVAGLGDSSGGGAALRGGCGTA